MPIISKIQGLIKKPQAAEPLNHGAFRGIGEMGGNFVKKTKGDKVIWAIVIILTLASLLLVYSSTGSLAYRMSRSTESYLFKQFALIVGGFLLIYYLHQVNYTVYYKVALFAFLISIPLLIYTLFMGVQLNEGSRWIKLPIINQTFQTSDLAKLSLFMFMSRVLSRKQHVIKSLKKGYLPLIIPVAAICILIAPANLSTALLIGITSMMLMFIGRVRTKHLLVTLLIVLIPAVFIVTMAMSTYNKETHRSEKLPVFLSAGRIPTWISRIQTFLYSNKNDQSEKLYQINQAKIAIANGGVMGRGPGNSVQRNFLPHSYSDFIYAIIVEEYGLIGAVFILVMYLLFLFRCIKIYRKCPFAFGAFLALALSFTLVFQAIVNMGVNVSLLPNTGVTLPLISMGGSSFVFTCISIGIILSVARNVEQLEGSQLDNINQKNMGLTDNLSLN